MKKILSSIVAGALSCGFTFLNTHNLRAQIDTTSQSGDSAMLDRVVVTALGINKEKKAVGYATQKIKGIDLIKSR